MKTCKLIVMALLMTGLGYSAGGAVVPGESRATSKPSDASAALLKALDVERQSQAYYGAVLNKHRPLHPFGVVYRMEQRHEQALVAELKQQSIPVPDDRWQRTTADVADERSKVLARAAELEKKTVRAYDRAIKKAPPGDVRQMLQSLRAESLEHQKWFADPETCPMGAGGRGPTTAGRGRRGSP
jgi:hypothetical protein